MSEVEFYLRRTIRENKKRHKEQMETILSRHKLFSIKTGEYILRLQTRIIELNTKIKRMEKPNE